MTASTLQQRPSGLPCSRIDTALLPLEERFEAWRAFDNVVSDIRPNAAGVRDPEASAIQWRLDDITVARKAYAPHCSSRRRADRRVSWNEHVRLRLYEKGRLQGLFGDTSTVLQAGDIHFADMAVDFRTSTGHMRHITFLIPYAAVGYDPSRHPAQIRLSTATPQGRILETAMRCLSDQLSTVSATEARALAQGLTGLVQGLLLADPPRDAARAQAEGAQCTAMRRYVDDNLANLDLGAERLCEVFHASRATVYRCFAEVGGVSRYVKERRLDRAFGELSAQGPARGRVRQVAERWGFFEAGHFNRCFRKRFGLSPSEVAALGEFAGEATGLQGACGLASGRR